MTALCTPPPHCSIPLLRECQTLAAQAREVKTTTLQNCESNERERERDEQPCASASSASFVHEVRVGVGSELSRTPIKQSGRAERLRSKTPQLKIFSKKKNPVNLSDIPKTEGRYVVGRRVRRPFYLLLFCPLGLGCTPCVCAYMCMDVRC
jgi:hypothetical protein